MRRVLELVIVFLVVAGAVVGITALAPTALLRTTQVRPPVDTKMVCLGHDQAAVAYVDGAEALADLGADPQPASGATVREGQEEPVVATSTRAVVGGTHTVTGAVASWIPCAPAVSEGILLVPATANTDVVVANSDPTDASVDLTLLGTDGEISALGSRGIAVVPGATRQVALSVLAPVEGPVVLEVDTSRGRATVAARTSSGTVLDAMTVSAPEPVHHLGGIPAGATRVQVLLANPTQDRVTVAVTALGTSASYTPEGGQEISLAPRSTLAVNLGASLAGEASGLVVEADGDIGAGLAVDSGADQGFAAPLEAGTELAVHGPAGGTLQLSNPSPQDAAVRVADQSHTIPAGTTLAVPLAEAPVVVTSDVEVFGAVAYTGESGTFIIPLQTWGELSADPIAARLDPTLR